MQFIAGSSSGAEQPFGSCDRAKFNRDYLATTEPEELLATKLV